MDMNPELSQWLNLAFRWLHVGAGVMWIGHLWFFNLVNAQVAKTYDADSKKKVVPELMPRALYWFRWGAAYTWVTGILLLGIVYYMGGALMPTESPKMGVHAGSAVGIGILLVGFALYDILWKSALAKNEMVGALVSLALATAAAWGMAQLYTGRAVFIHVGALFGTIMAANVWMRIWPAQKKIIAAIKEGKAPDAALAATAGLRSKHNTYMSVPLLFLMVSNHFPTVMGSDLGWAFIGAFTAVGWIVTKALYNKSAADAPKAF